MRRVEPVQIITVLLQCLLLCVLKQCSGQLTEPISSALAPFDYLALPFLKATGFQDYTCKVDKNDPKGVLNDFHLRGTALGGWLVLEPWLTPSLFYQFLGASEQWGDDAPKRVAIDSKTFCTALGKEEANRQLRNHWRTWVNESIVASLRESGVETLRIPVGDWMFVPYEPYIGCWDGAVEALDDMLDTIGRYNMTALIDVHALRDSQNGLDNSGDTKHFDWISTVSTGGAARYTHWRERGGDWSGRFNTTSLKYETQNVSNILHSLLVVDEIAKRYGNHPVVIGLEPVNEPWNYTPLDLLQEFYWRSYWIINQRTNGRWITLLHDTFRLTEDVWGTFLQGCDNWAVDTHIYQAWAWANPVEWFQQHACNDGDNLWLMEEIGVPIVVGEWSLATDNCAMWINGLNDNVPGYPKVQCEMVRCPDPYMGSAARQPNAPPDPSKGAQDPFGNGGESYVEYGYCPRDKPFSISGNSTEENEATRLLAQCKLYAFDMRTHGNFFWNFRTEFEPRWDYLRAVENGWFPRDWGSDNLYVQQINRSCTLAYATTTATAAAATATAESLGSGDKNTEQGSSSGGGREEEGLFSTNATYPNRTTTTTTTLGGGPVSEAYHNVAIGFIGAGIIYTILLWGHCCGHSNSSSSSSSGSNSNKNYNSIYNSSWRNNPPPTKTNNAGGANILLRNEKRPNEKDNDSRSGDYYCSNYGSTAETGAVYDDERLEGGIEMSHPLLESNNSKR